MGAATWASGFYPLTATSDETIGVHDAYDASADYRRLPGNERTIRGYSGANLIILDEASRIEDELVGGISPMLATTNGSLIALNGSGS